jgi:hypothetical protein
MAKEELKAGHQLQRWLAAHYDLGDCQPLATELCVLADRLAEIRELMQQAEKTLDKTRLMSAEVSVLGQYVRVWKALGLAEEPSTVDASALGRRAAMERWHGKSKAH